MFLVMSNLLNSTLLVYWDSILVDLAQVLHNTTGILSSYRCISPKIFCINSIGMISFLEEMTQLSG